MAETDRSLPQIMDISCTSNNRSGFLTVDTGSEDEAEFSFIINMEKELKTLDSICDKNEEKTNFKHFVYPRDP